MKVLFVSAVGTLGGAERMLLSSLQSLRASVPRVQPALLLCDDGPLRNEAERLGVATTVLPMPAELAALGDSALASGGGGWGIARAAFGSTLASVQYARRFAATVRGLAPDLVHSNGMKVHLLSATAPLKVPRVFHMHDFPGERPLMARALALALRRGVRTLAISRAVADDVRRTFGDVPLDVVYDAIDTERFMPAEGRPEMLDEAARLPPPLPGTLRIGLIATYARWKGHSVFLDAAARVVADRPNAELRFFVVGGPIYRTTGSQVTRAELEEQVRRLGLTGRVGFVPFTDDVAPVYRALDVVVHASTRPEPFGLTIVEAMACGRPVVVSAAGGARELFTDGVDALGFPIGKSDALAAQLGRLVESAAARASLSAEARRTAVHRFSQVRLGPELLAIYRSVLGET